MDKHRVLHHPASLKRAIATLFIELFYFNSILTVNRWDKVVQSYFLIGTAQLCKY